MGRHRKPTAIIDDTYRPIDPASREQQMIGLAVNLAEERIRNGTASSQIITHYLQLATEKASLERQLLAQDLKLKEAKTAAIEEEQRSGKLYAEVIEAMRRYNGEDI